MQEDKEEQEEIPACADELTLLVRIRIFSLCRPSKVPWFARMRWASAGSILV